MNSEKKGRKIPILPLGLAVFVGLIFGATLLSNAAEYKLNIGNTSLYLNDTGVLEINGTTNITGLAYYNNSLICTADNGLCTVAETDPVWNAQKASYLTIAGAAGTYQPIGSYLTAETDPAWSANSSSVARVGNCPAGTVVQNTTVSGVECAVVTSSVPYQSSAAGWTNTSTTSNTSLNVTINGNLLVQSAANRTWGITGLSSGQKAFFLYGGDQENMIENSYGGTAIFRAFHGIQFYNSKGEVARIATSYDSNRSYFKGYVGVNNRVTPTQALDVGGNILANGQLLVNASGSSIQFRIYPFSGTPYGTLQNPIFLGSMQNNSLVFRTADTDRMTLNASGALGIGTIDPTATLDVRALNTGTPNIVAQATPSQTAKVLSIRNSSGTDVFTIDPTGYVYLPGLPGTGEFVCFNTTSSALYRKATACA